MYDRMDHGSGVTACISGMTSDISSRKRKQVGSSDSNSPSRKLGKLREDDTRQSGNSLVTTLSEGPNGTPGRLKGEATLAAGAGHAGASPGDKAAGDRAHQDHDGARQRLGFDRLAESACQHAQDRMYDQFRPFSAAHEGTSDVDAGYAGGAGASTYPGSGTTWHAGRQSRKDAEAAFSRDAQDVSGLTKQSSAISKPGDTGSGISKPGDSGNATGLSDGSDRAQGLNADLSRSRSGTRSISVSRPAYGRRRPGDEASSREEDDDLRSTGEREKGGGVNASQWSQRSQPSQSSQEEDKGRQSSGDLESDDSNRSKGSRPVIDSRRLAGLAQSILGGKRSWRTADDDEDEESGRDLKCLRQRLDPLPAAIRPDFKTPSAPPPLTACGSIASLASLPLSELHAEAEDGAEAKAEEILPLLEASVKGPLGPSIVVPKLAIDTPAVPDGGAAGGRGAPSLMAQTRANDGGTAGPAGSEQTQHPGVMPRVRRGGSPIEGHEALFGAAREGHSDSILDVESSGVVSSYDNSMSDMQDGDGGPLFVLSSGRLRRRQGGPPSRPRQPTIDDEFEQYFSQMLL